jgi:hypothetical protein
MNPLDWLKALYETFGAPHPRSSFVVVIILGGICSAGVWALAAKQYEKSLTKPPEAVVSKPGDATASGDHNVAVSGNHNTIKNGQPEPSPTPKKKK